MKEIKANKYDFSLIQGISLNQLNQHYKLYDGYVSKINEIWATSKNTIYFSDSNATYSKLRSLKLGESYALDGVKLHELYFENLCGNKGNPSELLLSYINNDFISFDNFIDYFKAVGLSMRGWAIVTIDNLDSSMHITGSDSHDSGALWDSFPLLVMDVYEHAYMIDFGINRKSYIESFINNINWNVVNKRLENYLYLMSINSPSREFNPCMFFPTWNKI